MTLHGEPTPSGEHETPLSEIRERLSALLAHISEDPEAEPDFPLDEAAQKNFGVRMVQLDRDDSLEATFITLLRTKEQGVYDSEERYLLFDDGRFVHETVHVHYTYSEAITLYDYEKTSEDWKNYLSSLAFEGKLDEIDELGAMDQLIAQFKSTRDSHSSVMRQLSRESDDGGIDPTIIDTAKAVYSEALNTLAEAVSVHLFEATQHLNDSDMYFYTELFKRVITTFNKKYDVEMLATKRFVEASQDANLRLEVGLSPDVTLIEAWKLLTVLDVCD